MHLHGIFRLFIVQPLWQIKYGILPSSSRPAYPVSVSDNVGYRTLDSAPFSLGHWLSPSCGGLIFHSRLETYLIHKSRSVPRYTGTNRAHGEA